MLLSNKPIAIIAMIGHRHWQEFVGLRSTRHDLKVLTRRDRKAACRRARREGRSASPPELRLDCRAKRVRAYGRGDAAARRRNSVATKTTDQLDLHALHRGHGTSIAWRSANGLWRPDGDRAADAFPALAADNSRAAREQASRSQGFSARTHSDWRSFSLGLLSRRWNGG